MEHTFWQQKWEGNQLGFHLAEVNPLLTQYWSQLNAAPQSSVFVPLCGKSMDMHYFSSQGLAVIGNELSAIAVNDFFQEAQLASRLEKTSVPETDLSCYQAESFKLYQGDFFELSAAMIQPAQYFYDRGSLVALPDTMRQAYVKQLAAILPQGATGLLITLNYDVQSANPPFAISEDWLQTYVAPYFKVMCLTVNDVLANEPLMQARGATWGTESVYQLTRL